jgi:crotonobetainyl-CoA:carnitine CoA-transferase CaiB-like acyl-CoA transferase
VTGRCALPPGLHEATRRVPLARLEAIAARNGIAACRLRSYNELVGHAQDGVPAPWAIRPSERGASAPLRAAGAEPARPLAGVTVVELTTRLQGPLAGHLLRMLGADVVKVEPPGGDPGRMAPAGPFRAAYLALNRGKRFAEVDYKTQAGSRELHELVAGADVFLHNARPGRAERLGVDFDSVQRTHPGIVHAQLAGWDPSGPRAGQVAGDYIVQAACACGHGLSEAGEPPFPSPVTLLDVSAGLLACEGVLAGLLRRVVRGRGAGVRTTLEAAAAELQHGVVSAPVWGPLDRPLPTADGHLVVCVRDDSERRALAAACGVPRGSSDAAIADALCSRGGASEWEERLAVDGVAAARVRTPAELPGDPRVRALLEPLDTAGGSAPGAPWHFVAA